MEEKLLPVAVDVEKRQPKTLTRLIAGKVRASSLPPVQLRVNMPEESAVCAENKKAVEESLHLATTTVILPIHGHSMEMNGTVQQHVLVRETAVQKRKAAIPILLLQL